MSEIVHEMRNQLSIAVANVEAFIDGKIDPTRARLTAVLQALSELDQLIRRVDAVNGTPPTAASPVPPESFDVCSIIQNETLAVEALAGQKQLNVSARYCSGKHAECAGFRGDPYRVGQMVKNLLINAIRYTPAGGAIAVDCHHAAGAMVLSISDTGPGVVAEEIERIFSPGVRGSAGERAPGEGLGLSVVKRVAEEHGGSVSVDASVRKGARFTVALPGVSPGAAPCTACLSTPILVNGAS
jgi:signal transduction histidine kinase